jgi:hypothetical protein
MTPDYGVAEALLGLGVMSLLFGVVYPAFCAAEWLLIRFLHRVQGLSATASDGR